MNRIGSMNILVVAGLASVAVAVATLLIGLMHEVQDERIEMLNQMSEVKAMKVEDEPKDIYKPRGYLVKNPKSGYVKQ